MGELLDAWNDGKLNLSQRIGFAVGIGLATDTVVLATKTAGFDVAGYVLRGIDVGTMGFIVLVGVAALLTSLVYRRRFSFPVKPTASDAAMFGGAAVLGLFAWLFVQKYPIFPEYQKPDFAVHVQIAEGLLSGSTVTIPHGILYYGVHYQLASALLLVGGDPLATVQRTMAILMVMSPFIVYFVVTKIFSSSGAALATTLLYVLSGPVWYDSIFDSGLYANFFGLLVALFLAAALVHLSSRLGSRRAWALFLLVVAAAYFSHYTIITLLPALLAVPIVRLFRLRAGYKEFLIPLAVTVAPAALVVAVRPHIVHLILYFASASGGALVGSTPLSSALAAIPSISYLVLEVNDDVAFLFLCVFTGVFIYRLVISKDALLFVPVVWFVALIIAAPQNITAWRYSYEALLPFVLMAGYGMSTLLPKLKIQKRRSGESNAVGQYAKVGFVLAIMMSPIVIGGWGTTLAGDVTSDVQIQAQSQTAVYSAMVWLQSNTPANSSYLSVSDWRFTYSSLLFGRTTIYQYFSSEATALAYAQQQGAGYVIVTNLVTLSLPAVPQDYPWNTFQSTANATLVYSNSDVRVYQVV